MFECKQIKILWHSANITLESVYTNEHASAFITASYIHFRVNTHTHTEKKSPTHKICARFFLSFFWYLFIYLWIFNSVSMLSKYVDAELYSM